MCTLKLFCTDENCIQEAKALADHLGIDLIFHDPDENVKDLSLLLNESGLSLYGNGMTLNCDFTKMIPRIRPNNLNAELLIKAARIKSVRSSDLTVIDATAGFGEDSFLLAAAGFHVRMYERDPVIAALLKDGCRRAQQVPELRDIVKRMDLAEEDSIRALSGAKGMDTLFEGSACADIIYLDPMFPGRSKSGLVKKKFQLLHFLEKPCDHEEELLESALQYAPSRIIIKRPLKGDFLAGHKPSYSLKGKTVRYDIINIFHKER